MRDRRMDRDKRDTIFRNIGRIFTEVKPEMSEKRKRKMLTEKLKEDEENSLKEREIDEHFPHINDPVPQLMQVSILVQYYWLS